MFGKTVRVRLGDKTITGVAKDVAPDGALVLEGDEGTQSLYAGDVTVDFGDRC